MKYSCPLIYRILPAGKTFYYNETHQIQGNWMKRFPAILILAIVAITAGCITETRMTTSNILMLSEFIGPGNYTEITDEVIGDDQVVIFYIEASDYETKKTGEGYEFWLGIDIMISDEWNNTYVEEIDEKEIHTTNSTAREGTVWYKYSWFTGNMVRSGEYTVEINVKDRLSGKILSVSREFYLDLSRKNT